MPAAHGRRRLAVPPFAADQVIGGVGALWRVLYMLSPHLQRPQLSSFDRLCFAGVSCVFICGAVLPGLAPRVYARIRIPLIVVAKLAAGAMPVTRRPLAVLRHTPSALSLRAWFEALLSVRVFQVFLGGFARLPVLLWLPTQVYLVMMTRHSDEVCALEWWSHPLTRARVERFHRAMARLAALLWPEVGKTWPPHETAYPPLVQCRAATTFAALLLGVLAPALAIRCPATKAGGAAPGGVVEAEGRTDGLLAGTRVGSLLDSLSKRLEALLGTLSPPRDLELRALLLWVFQWQLLLCLLWMALLVCYRVPMAQPMAAHP